MSEINRRRTERVPLEIPVTLEEGTGRTRDISFSGIYFTTSQKFNPGDYARFTFAFDYVAPGKAIQLDCQGHVVRVEKLGDEYGIASTIDEISYFH